MNRNGSTTLLVIIISAVCLPVIAFSLNTLLIQSKLNFNRINTVQGELNLETEINRIVYNQSGVNNNITDIMKNHPNDFIKSDKMYKIDISPYALENLSAEISFENKKDDRPKFKLKVLGSYNGIEFKKDIMGSIFTSGVDNCDNGLVYSQGKSQDHINKIEELLTEIPKVIDMDFLPDAHSLIRISNYNNITIEAKSYTNSKVYYNNNKNNNFTTISNNRVFLIVMSDGINRNNVIIDSTATLPNSSNLSGIIYIENGDLTFKGKCNFQGLVLIKDGQINNEGQDISTITGKVVLNSFKDPRDDLVINYGHQNYLKYAKHLYPLLEPKIIK